MAALATVAAGADEVSKWDSRMAVGKATVDTNGVKWIDGRFLPIEGRAFDALHLMLKAYARLLLRIRSRPK